MKFWPEPQSNFPPETEKKLGKLGSDFVLGFGGMGVNTSISSFLFLQYYYDISYIMLTLGRDPKP